MEKSIIRARFRVRGIVQGVGFRPFVHCLASELGLGGFVLNDRDGVLIEVEGEPARVEAFERAVGERPPTLAAIESMERDGVEPRGEVRFTIRSSEGGGPARSPISPDVATCPECLAEVNDEAARRYRYPFTNCTNCGPRFTITISVPYDRPNTTMSGFEMCCECKAEYEDPGDRRFHAQPIACPRCGPRLRMELPWGEPAGGDPIEEAARMLLGGAILAVKGLGGFHLACDARNEDAVVRLRGRKAREEKPLAVMVADLAWARRIAHVPEAHVEVLESRRRPIVLLEKVDSELAPSVAPGNRYVGVMLPYTPLHHLLAAAVGAPLVLTSGNVSDEPIAFSDPDARQRLGSIADAFLTHDRDVQLRCDDSVVRVLDGKEYPLRRARGYAPEPLILESPFGRPLLAVGAELKHTFCLGIDRRAVLSQHIGDLETWEAMSAFIGSVEHYQGIFDVVPEVIAHDLHPDYLSTRWALEQEGVEYVGVQHHHAHIASCLADNDRMDQRVIGLALDGTGFGTDGTIWGCEVLICDIRDFERAAHLRTVPLPGSSAAIREPWRMGAVYLATAFGPEASQLKIPFVDRTRERWPAILQMSERGINSPSASSAGRLFDAVAALCDLRDEVTYEGQAAAELEQLADRAISRVYPCPVEAGAIDGVALVAAAAQDLEEGRPPREVAAAFHNGLAAGLASACSHARAASGLNVVALSGGTWQNVLLLHKTRAGLEEAGFEVLVHGRVPTNDGGISLGQAVVANARSS